MPAHSQYKYLPIISMLFTTVALAAFVMAYKLVNLGGFFIVSGGILIFPLVYAFADIVAEVYGYRLAKQIVWAMILCDLVFTGLTCLVSSLDSPSFANHQNSYSDIFNHLPRFLMAIFLGLISSSFVNIYFLSRWKILVSGKYFWLRSLGAVAIGNLVGGLVTDSLAFYGTMPIEKVISLMINVYVVKMVYAFIIVVPVSCVVNYLKANEPAYGQLNEAVNFNPFKL